MKRRLTTFLLLSVTATATAIGACGSDDTTSASVTQPVAARSGPTVVASTAWTGALAQAAGAAKVRLIAPADNPHPAGCEPKPSDRTAVTGADYVVLAEYDGFAKTLRDATASSARSSALTPENAPEKVRADVLALGTRFKTPERARVDQDVRCRVPAAQRRHRGCREAFGRIMHRAVQIYGSHGIATDEPIAGWWAQARASRISDGPSDVHRMVIARELLRLARDDQSTRPACGDVPPRRQ